MTLGKGWLTCEGQQTLRLTWVFSASRLSSGDGHALLEGQHKPRETRSHCVGHPHRRRGGDRSSCRRPQRPADGDHSVRGADRKSTRLNSSHANISYAVFCLKKTNILPPPSPAMIIICLNTSV